MNLAKPLPRLPVLLAVMLAARLLLGAIYSAAIPLWEANDEPFHYRFARFIATEGRLPSAGERAEETKVARGLGQYAQPPLYYLLVAPIVALVDTARDPVPGPAKPLAACGDLPIGLNIYLHPRAEDFPWRGAALAAHLVRLVSVALATAAALLVWMGTRVAWPDRPALALGAAGVAAFWPQFLYNSSIVNNDSLILFASALFLYLALRMVAAPPRLRDAAGMAVALGLCALSKASGVALVAPAALALVVWLARVSRGRRRARRLAVVALAVVIAAAALGLAALRSQVMDAAPGQRYVGAIQGFFRLIENPAAWLNSPQIKWGRLPAIFSETFWSFIAAYGWQNVRISEWVYAGFGAWMLAAIAGLSAGVARRRARASPTALLLAVFGAAALVSVYRSLVDGVFVAAGRYLAPAFPALAILFALGWTSLPRPRREPVKAALMLAPVMLLSAWAPFLYIMPTYAPPPRLAEAEFAALAGVTPLDARFEAGMRAVGYRVETTEAAPGGALALTLYLTTDRPIDAAYMTELVAIAPDGQGYGFCRTTPGRGQWPTLRWQPGEIIVDRYQIPLNDNFPAPARGFFSLSFFQPETGTRPALAGPAGEPWGEYLHFGFDSYQVNPP